MIDYGPHLLDDPLFLAAEFRAEGFGWETVAGKLNMSVRELRSQTLSDHKRFTLATDVQVYFCDPRSPWQRGSNENTNGLLRQYLPKGIDISGYSQAKLNAVARQLNERPRKTLGFQTPAEMFSQTVASTG